MERSGRINLLKKMMYLNTSYDFRTLKSYYAACLNEKNATNKIIFQIFAFLIIAAGL